MRKKTATTLIGAGAFSLALAVAIPLAVAPALLKAPGEVALETHSRSSAQKLNSATGKLETITIDLTRKLGTHLMANDKVAGSASVGVYDELLDLKQVKADGTVPPSVVDGKFQSLRAGKAVVAFDRSTGRGVTGFGSTVKTTGQTVKFPFGTDKGRYDYYDQSSQKSWPVSYVRTTTLKGLEVYEFEGTIPEVSLGQYGVLEGTDTLYSNVGRHVFVEPVTGSIVSSTTSPQTKIRLANGVVTPALLVDNLVPTDATIADRVTAAKEAKSKAVALNRAPWALGVLGLLLLMGGFALGSRRREDEVVELPSGRPDVSGVLPVPRNEPAVDQSTAKR